MGHGGDLSLETPPPGDLDRPLEIQRAKPELSQRGQWIHLTGCSFLIRRYSANDDYPSFPFNPNHVQN